MNSGRKDEFDDLSNAVKRSMNSPSDRGFVLDPEYARMSKREQKRYRKAVTAELNKALKNANGDIKDAKRERKAIEQSQAKSANDVARQLKAREKQNAKKTKRQRNKRNRANNSADVIGYNLMFKNGICEVEEGYYSETLAFDDVTYQNAREAYQKGVLSVMCDIYNYLNAETTVQFSVINTPLREDELQNRRFYDPEAQSDMVLREDAETMNEVLSDKLAQGVSNLKRTRCITIAVRANDPEEAYRRLSRINTDLSAKFEQIRCSVRVLKGTERLEIIQSLLRPRKKFLFDYEKDLSIYNPACTKDYICPMSMDFKPADSSTFFKMDDNTFAQVLVMRRYDSPLDDTVVANLVDMQIPIEVSWYLKPYEKAEAITLVKTRRAWIDKEIITEQRKAVQQGYDYSILPSDVKYSREETEDLLNQLQGQQQHLFDFCGLIYTWADSMEKLNEQVLQIFDVAGSAGIQVETLEYRQRQGLNSILPLGLNHIEVSRPFTTAEACIFVPFATQELEDEGGNWYYQNKLSNKLVTGDRSRLASPVGFISGKTGSGKGFFAKNEIEGTLLSKPDDQIIIFDRAGEYRLLVEHAGGTYATFGVGKPAHMNPLGMSGLEHQDFATQVAFKADAMIAQAAAAASETDTVFSEEERSIIQRCVEAIFKRYHDEGGREPILEDFYQELNRQPEPVAKQIALRYERYTTGVSSFFNHVTDIDLSARMVGLNFKEVPDSMLVFSLIAFCETVRYIMYANFDKGRRTWLYIEEMESLFKYPSVLNYFRRFANECRKFGMYLTGITQSAESMIRNPDANAIVKNSDFIMLLKQSKEDRDYWENALGLSPLEVQCIDEGAPRGWGLLVFGDTRIPIKGEFPTDNHLYELFSTDPNEWVEKKTREVLDANKSFESVSDKPKLSLQEQMAQNLSNKTEAEKQAQIDTQTVILRHAKAEESIPSSRNLYRRRKRRN